MEIKDRIKIIMEKRIWLPVLSPKHRYSAIHSLSYFEWAEQPQFGCYYESTSEI